jgi:glutamate--cysteine ligase
MGVSQEQLLFLELFMLFCLLLDSPPIHDKEQKEIDRNLELVAHIGRDERLTLLRHGADIHFKEWADEICSNMQGICEQLDGDDAAKPYSSVLARQREVIADPELTPSARMLADMRANGEGFFHFAKRMSQQHRAYFAELQLSQERQQLFAEEVTNSIQQQSAMESADQIDFDLFLSNYFNQS